MPDPEQTTRTKRGGRREGAGRKRLAAGEKKLCRRLYLTEAQWQRVQQYVREIMEEPSGSTAT